MTHEIRLFQPSYSALSEQAVLEVMRSGNIASGPAVELFEQQLGTLFGRQSVVCTSDMTHAMAIALFLAGVGRGDEVLTLAFSCMASNSAIHMVGATPIWVDVNPNTASISIPDLNQAITPRCKAVTMYHVAGYPGAAEEVAAFCKQRGIALIEDCNNAVGASLAGSAVGLHGDYAIYSFYPNRQINAFEGGAVVCPNTDKELIAKKLRRYGLDAATFRDALGEIDPKSSIPEIGFSASFSNLNATVGLSELNFLNSRLLRTQEIAGYMHSALSELAGLKLIKPIDGAVSSYWVLLALFEKRDILMEKLKRRGINCSKLHHRNDTYSGFSSEGRLLPGTDYFADHMLALPCGWWLTNDQVEALVSAIRYELLN